MQLHQTDEFGASRKDAGHDEVGRIVYCSLFLARRWIRETEKGEREREREGVFTLDYYYHPGHQSEGG